MKRNLIVIAIVLAAAVAAGVATAVLGGLWPLGASRAKAPGAAVASKSVPATTVIRSHYVTLERLIVMLRDRTPAAHPHYLALDLVFGATDAKQEKRLREQLPMLRALAYRTLAGYDDNQVRQTPVDALAAKLKAGYVQAYGTAEALPFADVLISKMMVD
ncbi:flagellar basal body-associated FliL family protein [Burkholderia sp. Ac-20379]|uniref:flagellar basal body-associated FliL family protein n=1 Tax=Burkholderia sp. Ac-20379 TaxID=2703900 RepID=UPI001981CD11|nr:flagellar basal body-associated FliL family protein [Burkholderia sp. Ac-20379]MBN3728757.1 flagellar basal body-associated FliL family protein [Burkholderia sp. Ac-20379]